MSAKSVLVIRATGTQGQAVTKHLLDNGFAVHAYVKDLEEDRAKDLQTQGAKLFLGSLDDTAALDAAASGCYGTFLNQMPTFTDDAEIRDAKNIIAASKKAGVQILVHSTSFGTPDKELVAKSGNLAAAAITGKAEVEELVKAAGFSFYTILRPGYFMTNFFWPGGAFMFPELASQHKLISNYGKGCILPLVDPYDIGAFAAAAYKDPAKFDKAIIPLSSHSPDVEEIAKATGKAAGKNIVVEYRSDEEVEEMSKVNPLVAGAMFMKRLAIHAREEEAKSWGVKLHTFDEFLARETERVKKTFSG